MSQPITRKDLFELRDGLREDIKVSTRDIISHFNSSQAMQNDRMDKMDGRLDKMDGRLDKMDGRLDKMDEKLEVISDDVAKVKLAVVDLLGTERHLKNLVEELQHHGIAIDAKRVFAR